MGSSRDIGNGGRRGRGPSPRLDATIAQATVRAISKLGPSHVSIEAIAREAGCSKSSIYRRGLSKDDLVLRALGAVWLLDEPGDDPFTALVRTRADSFTDVTYLLTILMLLDEAVRGTELGRRFLAETYKPLRTDRAEVLTMAVEKGEIRADVDVDLLLDVVVGTLLFRRTHHPEAEPDIADRLANLLREGIGVRGPD